MHVCTKVCAQKYVCKKRQKGMGREIEHTAGERVYVSCVHECVPNMYKYSVDAVCAM